MKVFLFLILSSAAFAQYSADFSPVIEDYFKLLSGSGGKRDWDKFRNLFLPSAQLNAVGINEKGENQFYPVTLDEYIHHVDEYIKTNSYFVREVKREVTFYYSRMANIISVYEASNELEGEIIDRGFISFQLVLDNERWRIVNVLWNSETEADKIPGE